MMSWLLLQSFLNGRVEQFVCFFSSQERQRLETILSLCSELGQVDKDGAGTTVADLQKINQELEKLQVNDDDDDDDDTLPVFLDSVNGTMANGHMAYAGLENGYYSDDLQVLQRRSGDHRDNRMTKLTAESSPASLRSFAPSPSPRMQRNIEVLYAFTSHVLNSFESIKMHIKYYLSVSCSERDWSLP